MMRIKDLYEEGERKGFMTFGRVIKIHFEWGERMRKLAAVVICIVFAVGAGNVFAQPLKRHTFELGPEVSYIVYKEPGQMKERGMMYGLIGSYSYHNKIMLKADAKGSWGKVDYSNSGKIDNLEDYMLEGRGLVGYDFPIAQVHSITPYVGVGYRYLNDDGSGKISSTGARGYERESNCIYSPIGMEFSIHLGNGLFATEILEFDYFWWGKQKTHLSDIDPGYNDPENRQRKGYGLRGSMTLKKKFEKVGFEIGPFIKFWSLKKSDTEPIKFNGSFTGLYLFEPKNNSTEFGVKLSVTF